VKNRTKLIAAGCSGSLVAYAVFYLKHADVIDDFISTHHATGALLGLVCLAIVSGASGMLAMSTKPATAWAAMLSGLGAPGMIFAASANSGSSEAGAVEQACVLTLDDLAAKGSVFGDSLRLVFGPVTAVEKHARTATARSFDVQIATFKKSTTEMTVRLTAAEQETVQLREQLRVRVPTERVPKPRDDALWTEVRRVLELTAQRKLEPEQGTAQIRKLMER